MSKTQIIVFGIFFPLLFCSIGALFFFKGYQFFKTKKAKKEQCQLKTQGIIKAISTMRMDNSHAYFYTYEYEVNQQLYEVQTKFGSTKRQFNKGDLITVCYDHSDPNFSYIDDFKEDTIAALASLIAGIVVFVIGLFVFFFIILSL